MFSILLLASILVLLLFNSHSHHHFIFAIPALVGHSPIQSQFKILGGGTSTNSPSPPVPGQIFSGDQLPQALKNAPIVQPPPPSRHQAFASSFSGYSFDYSPEAAKVGANKSPSSSSQQSPNSNNNNPYDSPQFESPNSMASSSPRPQSPSSSQSPPIPNPPKDAFILRPSPSEQFVLPPPSLPSNAPSKMSEDLARFLPPANSQKPKLTGWVIGVHNPPPELRRTFPGGEAIVNPAAYFMEGADLNRIHPPRCSLIGCKGPVPNDFDFHMEQEMSTGMEDRTCHRAFVPLNGCWDGRGYPIGMICSICCECSTELAAEMRKSRGWIQGYREK